MALVGISRVYLDSYYVLEMVNKNKSHLDVQKLMYRLKQPAFEVLVSQTVLGEVVAKILLKPAPECADALSRIPQILQDHNIDPVACLTPPPSAALEIMQHLHSNDPYLDATDIMIVSHVLSDPNSKFFFTNDAKLLKSRQIKECEQQLRDDGKRETDLKISGGL